MNVDREILLFKPDLLAKEGKITNDNATIVFLAGYLWISVTTERNSMRTMNLIIAITLTLIIIIA